MTSELKHDAPLKTFRDREQHEVSLWWIAAVLLRQRGTLLAVTALGTGVGLAIALLRAPTYTTTLSFVPQAAQDPGRSGLASLAGQLGVSLGAAAGQAQSPQFYADLLSTREILEPVARDTLPVSESGLRVPLVAFFGTTDTKPAVALNNTVTKLRDDVIKATVAIRTTGVVSVDVRTESPYVSLGIAERLLFGLNRFNLVTRQSQAAAERRFVQGRVEEARKSLRAAEDVLQRFLQGNRQFTNSPQLTFQRDRLDREVVSQQQVVTGLVQQYEDARIREVRDTPAITVIERPSLAARSDQGERRMIVVTAAAVSLFVAGMFVLAREMMARDRERP